MGVKICSAQDRNRKCIKNLAEIFEPARLREISDTKGNDNIKMDLKDKFRNLA